MRPWILAVWVCGLAACGGSSTDPLASTDAGTDSGTGSDAAFEASDVGSDGGATCGGEPCVGAGMICDPADSKCKPDGKSTNVGKPCPKTGPNPACGTDPRATCNDFTSDGFPGGYCSVEPCTVKSMCPIGASCGRLGGESAACWMNCKTDAECPSLDYVCADMEAFYVSGASHKVCFLKEWPCGAAADCPSAKPKCGSGGFCTP